METETNNMKQQTFTNNKSTLYLVATPIGNLEEMTYRSINILKSVKLIACEDTRNTKVLTNHYNIETPLLSYHEHNERMMCDKIISILHFKCISKCMQSIPMLA